MSPPILEIKNLNKSFRPTRFSSRDHSLVHAVQDVSFSISEGTTLGLVGESGSGKSTLGLCILHLLKPDSGKILFQGKDLNLLSEKEWRPYRRQLQIVFQDPYASLNPKMTVYQILEEPLVIHQHWLTKFRRSGTREERVRELVSLVGLSPEMLWRYPHEFSGGQRQRVGIARALALEPALIVCDEPVSSLDVSVQAQILNLLVDLQEKLKLSFLFISHDLRVIRYLSHQVAVMQEGKIVEMGNAKTVFTSPQNTYTKSLLSAIPKIETSVFATLRRTSHPPQ